MRMPEPEPERTLVNHGMQSAEALTARQGTRSNGTPLDSNTRTFMESRFGHDFNLVRIHADSPATQAASAFRARAFTVGNNIVFGEGQYAPGTLRGRQLLAHELTHVVQQRAAGAPLVIQRQEEGEQPAPPDGGTTQAPLQPQPSGQAPAQVAPQPSQAPARQPWTPLIPRIWFDLHDSFRSVAEPQGPYLYSSYAYVDRVVNPNFQDNLNPGPARNLTTRSADGMPVQAHDLDWFFYTKFFVDAADAHLPPQYTRFETSASVRFVPAGGGAGFSYPFSDNNPTYISPGTLSYPFTLSTNPYGFRAQDTIMEPGTLQWDARLLVAYTDDRVPLWIEFVPPPGITDPDAFNAELFSRGLRRRDPVAGEAARRYRVTYTPRANDRFDINIDVTEDDGTVFARRRIPDAPRSELLTVPALVIAIGNGATASGGSSYGQRHVEIRASQRVPFERPAATTP
jgi:hypothetical protein